MNFPNLYMTIAVLNPDFTNLHNSQTRFAVLKTNNSNLYKLTTCFVVVKTDYTNLHSSGSQNGLTGTLQATNMLCGS